jgi:outer membrane protein assembly factor BamB/ribosomal protein L7/L12
MPDNQPTTLTCPTCGAPLEPDGRSTLVRCKFCHNVSLVPGLPGAETAAPAGLEEIRDLARGGNLLEAIRLYRERYNVGLAEARRAVEDMQAGRLVEIRIAEAVERQAGDAVQGLRDVRQLIGQGNKLEAIKRYRELFDVSLARAKYAVEKMEAGETAFPESGFPQAVVETGTPAVQKKASRAGCIVTASILLFVGGLLALIFLSPGGPFVPRLILNGPAELLPAEAGAQPDVVGLFYNLNDEVRQVGRVQAGTGRMIWRADALPGDGYAEGLAQDGSRVYVASGSDLFAYRLEDGSLAWQAVMPDRLSYQDDSLLAVPGRVLSYNLDQSLQAYDAASGALVWSRRLAYSSDPPHLFAGQLLVFDELGDSTDPSLVFLDPADGSQANVLAPACPYSEYSSSALRWYSGLLTDPAEGSLYAFYDSSPGCVQRLDATSGALLWQTLAEDRFSNSFDGYSFLADAQSIYFQNDGALMQLDRQKGTLKTLLAVEDYEPVPLALEGGLLLVRARRTLGSERFELWGVEAASGERLWQIDLQSAGPIDPPDEMSGLIDSEDIGWTWRVRGNELLLIEFGAEPNRMTLRRYSLQDGSPLGESVIPLKKVVGDFYSIPTVIGWSGDLLYLDVDASVLAVDVARGEILFEY